MIERGELRSTFYEIDRQMDLLRGRLGGSVIGNTDFMDRLETSWIYHEHAMEGVVLTQDEIKAALDSQPVSDISLAPVYEDVRRQKIAIDQIRRMTQKKRVTINLDLVKKVHQMFLGDDDGKAAGKYRKDIPIHRSYFHEITPPDKITVRMRQLMDWLDTQEAKRMHPVKLGARLHYEFLRIYPFTHHSGRIARLLMNIILLQNDYLPAIIHAVERQRYYEALRLPAAPSITLVIESMENGIQSALKILPSRDSARVAV